VAMGARGSGAAPEPGVEAAGGVAAATGLDGTSRSSVAGRRRPSSGGRQSVGGGSSGRARSACDQLVNATARAVVHAHHLLADEAVLARGMAPVEAKRRYLSTVDTCAVDLVLKCKVVSTAGKETKPKCASYE
jgi:hypothetical protein